MSVLEYIDNKIDLNRTDFYAAILGETPSKGARSPALWNYAFEALSLSAIMHPMDVSSRNLESLIHGLGQDRRFVGGAVTMPYKTKIIPFIDELEPEAELIGSVNCIYRKGDRLVGTNTDGAAALWSLKEQYGKNLEGKKILVLGTGGAGAAVSVYLAAAVGKSGRLVLANRSEKRCTALADRLKKISRVELSPSWPVDPESAHCFDVIINCTVVGFDVMRSDDGGFFSLRNYTPLGMVENKVRTAGPDKKEYIGKAAAEITENYRQTVNFLARSNAPFVFDIIYQPLQTLLLFLADQAGCETLNGLPMNLEQAVIAFDKTTSQNRMRAQGTGGVRELMKNVK